MERKKVTLIISFYNKLEWLKLVLAALETQSCTYFEIIIADDGSSTEVVNKLEFVINSSKLDIKHVWHENKGWRKNIILNKAIVASTTDYLVFIYGDCIPHPRFIEEHYSNKEDLTVLVGRRMFLSNFVTKLLNEDRIKKGYLQNIFFLASIFLRIFGKGNYLENGVYIKSPFLRQFFNKKIKGIVGSNFSLHKKDMLEINGFDERFIYPGAGEDSDVRNRWLNRKGKIKTIKHIAVQYHLYHIELERDKRNLEFLNENIEKKVIYTPYGIKDNFNF